jgi:RHS repeat-associated protein
MDDQQRIALVEMLTEGADGSPENLIRYQFNNHLETACLELDDQAEVISYEEYYPYGSTSYQAKNARMRAVAKRYRYSGKEWDEEGGLYYYGARYYAPWLGRWNCPDPLGIADGVNLYLFVQMEPIKNYDLKGTSTTNNSEDIEMDWQAIELAPYRELEGGGFEFYDRLKTKYLTEQQYERLQHYRSNEKWLLEVQERLQEWKEEDRLDRILNDPGIEMTDEEAEKWSSVIIKRDEDGNYYLDLEAFRDPRNIELGLRQVSDIRQGYGFIVALEASAHKGRLGGHARVGFGWIYVPGGHPEGYDILFGRAEASIGAGAKAIAYINFITMPVDLMNLDSSAYARIEVRPNKKVPIIFEPKEEGIGGGFDISFAEGLGARIRASRTSKGLSVEGGPTVGIGASAMTVIRAGLNVKKITERRSYSYPMDDLFLSRHRPGL